MATRIGLPRLASGVLRGFVGIGSGLSRAMHNLVEGFILSAKTAYRKRENRRPVEGSLYLFAIKILDRLGLH